MNKTTLRLSSSFLSALIVLSTLSPAMPALAAEVEVAPARLAPAILPLKSVAFTYSPNAAELPTLANAQLPSAQAQIPALQAAQAGAVAVETLAQAPLALPAPLASAAAMEATPVFSNAQTPKAEPERASFIARAAAAVRGEIGWGQIFDRSSSRGFASTQMGIRPLPEPTLPSGIKLDPPPASPVGKNAKGSVTIDSFFGAPGAKTAGGVFDAGPKLLKANPKSAADVERAVREMIDLDAAKYGVTSNELITVHASLVEGKAHQADTVYILFNQTRESKNPADPTAKPERIAIHGARLSFTIKIVGDQPVLFSSMGQLYPNIAVNTDRVLNDTQLKDQAEKRLGIPPNSPYELQFVDKKIIFSQGAWHAANLYTITGFPVTIAVDIATGEAFAWDPRMGMDSADDNALARFAIAYRGTAPMTEERLQAVKDKLAEAGLKIVSIGNGGTLVVAEGKVSAMGAIAQDAALRAWTIHRYTLAKQDLRAKDTSSGNEGSAVILGRGEKSDTRPNGQPALVPLPMSGLEITMADGRKVTTDKNGRFVVESKDGAEVAFSAALEGTWARVVDSQGRALKINGSVKPGSEGQYAYNAQGDDEWVYNLINTFQGINRVHDWLRERFPDARIDRAIKGTSNIDQECNAYYTPGSPSLNFFHSSVNCSDTGRPGIIAHEYGHFWDDMIGGIVNGGLSEGWGDILSMFIFGSPIIGDGFLKNTSQALPASFLLKMGVNASTLNRWADAAAKLPLVGNGMEGLLRPSYIRHGENTYQYNENDEVHQQGEAWMGFAWQLRKSLIAKLGEAAGAAMAESLIIPTMLAKAGDIPAAMAQVLLADMGKDGSTPHEAEIRAAAKMHGIDLPAKPGLVKTLVDKTTMPLRKIAIKTQGVEKPFVTMLVPTASAAVAPEAAATAVAEPAIETLMRARLTFTAGALVRARVKNEIAKYCDYHGLKYSLKEYKSWLSSDFFLSVEGPKAQVEYLAAQIQRWADASK